MQKIRDIPKDVPFFLKLNILRKERLIMASNGNNTKNAWIFQEFLFLLGHLVHSNLMRQIDYLKVENKILRNKAGKIVKATPVERRLLIGIPSLVIKIPTTTCFKSNLLSFEYP